MNRTLLSTLIPLALASGCVSQKKYNELQASYLDLGEDHRELAQDHAALRSDYDRLQARVASMSGQSPQMAAYYSDLLQKLRPMMEDGTVQVVLTGDRMTIALSDAVFFGSGDYALTDTARSTLRDLSNAIQDIPDVHFQVEGHTDTQSVLPSATYSNNWDLGAERAEQALQVLVRNGVDADRLSLASYADTEPMKDEMGAVRANRRVQITIEPDLARVDGAARFVRAAERNDALYADDSFDRMLLRAYDPMPSTSTSTTTAVAVQTAEPRPSEPALLHDFTIPVVNGGVVKVQTTADDKLLFEYGQATLAMRITPDEVEDEIRELYDEVAGWEVNEEVTGNEIDDEIRDLLTEAIDHDTIVFVDGMAVPGHRVDREVGEYFKEILDRPDQMDLHADEISDEWKELKEQAREAQAMHDDG